MLRLVPTVLSALVLTTEAIVPQVPLGDVVPTWEKESKSYIVPLHKKARTGLIGPALEEGLIAGLGPRFVNPFYDNLIATTSAASATCVGACSSVALELQPCILAAMRLAEHKLQPSPGMVAARLLNCTVKPSQICACASCMPKKFDTSVANVQRLASFSCRIPDPATTDADQTSPYVDLLTLADSSSALSAFRGDLYTYQQEQLRLVNSAGRAGSRMTEEDVCLIGSYCGSDCGCCVGACAEKTTSGCLGACT